MCRRCWRTSGCPPRPWNPLDELEEVDGYPESLLWHMALTTARVVWEPVNFLEGRR